MEPPGNSPVRRRVALANLPTPLAPLERLSAEIGGPKIWIKRDDLTGLALGGNKTRKLEPLVAAALDEGADVLVTGGATQSNHCRQTAAAAARAGLRCALVLRGNEPAKPTGNLLLDVLLGAGIHWTGDDNVAAGIERTANKLRDEGVRPFVIPYGGSNALGASAYADAMAELETQRLAAGVSFDRIVFASSSGGTHAGLLVGSALHGCASKLHGIAIDKHLDGVPLRTVVVDLANEVASLLGCSRQWTADDVLLDDGFVGEGYGAVGDLEHEAIALLARTEGILLDPVYTGRSFAGLLHRFFDGTIDRDEHVLFWHTGGQPALFA